MRKVAPCASQSAGSKNIDFHKSFGKLAASYSMDKPFTTQTRGTCLSYQRQFNTWCRWKFASGKDNLVSQDALKIQIFPLSLKRYFASSGDPLLENNNRNKPEIKYCRIQCMIWGIQFVSGTY